MHCATRTWSRWESRGEVPAHAVERVARLLDLPLRRAVPILRPVEQHAVQERVKAGLAPLRELRKAVKREEDRCLVTMLAASRALREYTKAILAEIDALERHWIEAEPTLPMVSKRPIEPLDPKRRRQ